PRSVHGSPLSGLRRAIVGGLCGVGARLSGVDRWAAGREVVATAPASMHERAFWDPRRRCGPGRYARRGLHRARARVGARRAAAASDEAQELTNVDFR